MTPPSTQVVERRGATIDNDVLERLVAQHPEFTAVAFELRECWSLLNRERPSAASKDNLFMSALMMNGYQNRVLETVRFSSEVALNYLPNFIAGEAGEIAQEFARMHLLDKSILTGPRREAVKSEIGDNLWGLAALAGHLEEDLSEIAHANLIKVTTRGPKGLPPS